MAAGTLYTVLCLSGCGEHYATNDADRAWDEATAHERGAGHETRVVTTPNFERRRRGLPHALGMGCTATDCAGPHREGA